MDNVAKLRRIAAYVTQLTLEPVGSALCLGHMLPHSGSVFSLSFRGEYDKEHGFDRPCLPGIGRNCCVCSDLDGCTYGYVGLGSGDSVCSLHIDKSRVVLPSLHHLRYKDLQDSLVTWAL